MVADETLLAQFVSRLAAGEDMTERIEEVPLELWDLSAPEEGIDWVRWKPVAYSTPVADVDALEARLPVHFPPLYRLLISQHRYLRVEFQSFCLLANPPSPGLDGLAHEMFRDPVLSSVLLQHGFVQFAKADYCNYDPVCFNTARRAANGDMEVVCLDHEQILCYDRIRLVSVLAPSFRALLKQVVSG